MSSASAPTELEMCGQSNNDFNLQMKKRFESLKRELFVEREVVSHLMQQVSDLEQTLAQEKLFSVTLMDRMWTAHGMPCSEDQLERSRKIFEEKDVIVADDSDNLDNTNSTSEGDEDVMDGEENDEICVADMVL